MFSHILLSNNSTHGPALKSALNQFEAGYRALIAQQRAMETMIDAGSYTEVTARYGTQSDAFSAQMKAELDSMLFKLTTDAQVDFVKAAIEQALDKFR